MREPGEYKRTAKTADGRENFFFLRNKLKADATDRCHGLANFPSIVVSQSKIDLYHVASMSRSRNIAKKSGHCSRADG
jgi:hypothetical protein